MAKHNLDPHAGPAPVRLVESFIPSLLKMVMKKMDEDAKSYYQFYYLLLTVSLVVRTQHSGVGSLGKPRCRQGDCNQKSNAAGHKSSQLSARNVKVSTITNPLSLRFLISQEHV